MDETNDKPEWKQVILALSLARIEMMGKMFPSPLVSGDEKSVQAVLDRAKDKSLYPENTQLRVVVEKLCTQWRNEMVKRNRNPDHPFFNLLGH